MGQGNRLIGFIFEKASFLYGHGFGSLSSSLPASWYNGTKIAYNSTSHPDLSKDGH
jgi:hypothetical protein